MYEEGFGIVTPTIASNKVPVFNLEIENVFKKFRKAAKIFRKSPVKNKVLQNYVLLEQNNKLSLVLDCKSRWSSMYETVERFIYLKKCMSKALPDLSIEQGISTTKFLFLNGIKWALEPINLEVEILCSKDATLLTVEGVFQFLFVELEKRKSSLAENLLCAIKTVYNKDDNMKWLICYVIFKIQIHRFIINIMLMKYRLVVTAKEIL